MIKKTIRLIILSIILSSNAQLFANDVGNNYVTAKTLKVNSIFKSNIESVGDVDFYRVPIKDYGTLKIFTSGSTDTVGHLMNSNRTVLTESNDDTDKEINFFLEYDVKPGIYYVTVKNANQQNTGEYTLHVFFESAQKNSHAAKLSQVMKEAQNRKSKYSFEYKANCVTEGTTFTGVPRTCESTECFSLPDDYVYIPPFEIHANVEGVIPAREACSWWSVENKEYDQGLELPNKICIKARAKSKGGMFNMGHRGWAHCIFKGSYIQIPEKE